MVQEPHQHQEELEDVLELLEDDPSGLLPDGAGFYAETNPNFFVMEPFNAISSLAFLIPVIYFMIKLKGRYKEYSFLTYCMPLLFIGGVGSTLFHAFRISPLFLIMDFLPIAILTLSVSIYFWVKVLRQKWIVFILIPLFVVMRLSVFSYFQSDTMALNISYFITGVMIFVPGLMYLHKTQYKHSTKLVWTVVLFMLALFFRRFDFEGMVLMPMGTHWLWHISCAAGALMLGEYLYRVKDLEKEFDTDSYSEETQEEMRQVRN
ncbi:hypothetical protein BH23BAC1_BH23BAC1_04350 [soil metagenome]